MYIFGLPSLTQGVKFWNPILIAAFSGCLFLFSQAFLPPGLHDYHPTSLNLTKSYETGHFDSTSNLSTAKPGVLHSKASLQMRDLVDSIKNKTSDVPPIFLDSDPPQLGRGSSQVVTPRLAPVIRNNLWDWDIKRSFSSRFLSNPPKLRPSYLSLIDNSINNIYDLDSSDPGYDPLELEPYFSTGESSDRRQIFALKIWLDPKDFPRAKIGAKVEICQASRGVKCFPDSSSHHGV